MKFSTGWKLTPTQRQQDRKRAERALGRRTREPECIHHHSPTQLVICQDTQYHALLHQLHHAWRIEHDLEFGELLIAREEAKQARLNEEVAILRRMLMRFGALEHELDELVATPLDKFQGKTVELWAKMRARVEQ